MTVVFLKTRRLKGLSNLLKAAELVRKIQRQVHSFPALQPPPTCLPASSPFCHLPCSRETVRLESPQSSGQVLGLVAQAEGPRAALSVHRASRPSPAGF